MKNYYSSFSLPTVILLSIIMISCKQVPEEYASSDKYRLVWTDDPTSTITIAWDQLDNTNAEVLYGSEDQGRKFWKYPESQVAQEEMNRYQMQTRFAKLSGLRPDTRYYFVLKDEKGISERYWFKTAPAQPQPFTFVAGGDTKSEGLPLEAGRASNRMVAKLRPLFVMINGDFTSGNGTNADWWKTWLSDWHTLTTAEDGRMIPIFPVMGNHENGNQRNLNIIFNAPYQQNDTIHIYNSLNVGGDLVHLIGLNSEIRTDSLQKEWLINDLEAHKGSQFKLAGYHKPFFPHTQSKRENHRYYEVWAWIFQKYGLDLSIDGDSHMHKITYPVRPDSSDQAFMGFVRDDHKGTMFIGEGSWGARPRDNNDDKPWTLTSGSFNQIKWIHVLPENENMEAHIDIYTVITGEYDESGAQTLYDSPVESLTEENLLALPANIRLHQMENFGHVVRYPFHLN